jgi:hypothetical protein
MTAVQHGVVFVDGRVGFFTPEDQAGDFGGLAVRLCQQLVDAGATANAATGFQWSTAEPVWEL